MDKYEYKLRSDEIVKLIEKEKYVDAVNIADTIDWRRVKSLTMLLRIAALYRVNRRNEDSKAVLMLAYDRYPTNRSVVYSLCEVSIELDDVVAAIEYYKEFVKLAPRDNGVFTLRYRILEAQEASLEERIELLEELKKRDYQEEWAYELAYLYHRVGLGTKCVEECDDLILWFGDGPYVMKAMELKMLHAPLTAIQEKKYAMMQAQVQGIPEDEAYAEDANNTYQEDTYNEQAYTDEGYVESTYNDTYQDDSYQNDSYSSAADEDNYYGDSSYSNDNAEAYEETYGEDGYADNSYPYAYNDENYTENAYNDDSYSAEGYQEQTYVGATYTDEEPEQTYESDSSGKVYSDTAYSDMSQYNTINLQKVVAESMRELFPDDEDMYAENREEIAAIEKEIERASGKIDQAEDTDGEEEKSTYTSTGRVAALVTGVSEIAPDPQAGAIKTVIVPGQDAQYMQQDTDINMLRNTSEQEVNEEQQRYEHGDENVYEERPSLTYESSYELNNQEYESNDEEEHIPFRPMTGQMNIQDVLIEWERMKKENEEKRKEGIRQHVLQQTGQLFKDFDDSINSGILGELAQEEKEISQNQPTFRTETFLEDDETEELEEIEENEENEESDELGDSIETEGFEEAEQIDQNDQIKDLEEELVDVSQAVPSPVAASSIQKPRIIIPPDAIPPRQVDTGKPFIVMKKESKEDTNDDFLSVTEEAATEELPNINDTYEEVEESNTEEQLYEEAEESNTEEQLYEEAEESNTEEQLYEEAEESDAEEQLYEEAEESDAQEQLYEEVEESNTEEQLYEEAEENDAQEQLYEEAEESDVEEQLYKEAEEATESEQTSLEEEQLLKTQEISMNTEEISSLPERIIAATKKETTGVNKEKIREFTPEEQEHFEDFAVTKKIRKQIINALDNMTLASYTGNVMITGEPGLGTLRLAKNLIREFQTADANFSGKVAKITGEQLNIREIKETFDKLSNGALIIEEANGLDEKTLYKIATLLNQDDFGLLVFMTDTKKGITKLLEKQAMIADYFNIRIDLMEMDNNALVAYAKNYAQALEYSIDELGTLALYTRIANIQTGNHVVTKDEVRDIVDEAIWKSKRFRLKNFVDVLFSKRYDQEDMIVLKERDFI